MRKKPSGGHNGGRPLSRKKRCFCGFDTMRRAEARYFDYCREAGFTVRYE